VWFDEIGDAPEKSKQETGTEAQIRLMPPGEANMEVIIAIGWIVGIWVVVLAFSVYFSQNLK